MRVQWYHAVMLLERLTGLRRATRFISTWKAALLAAVVASLVACGSAVEPGDYGARLSSDTAALAPGSITWEAESLAWTSNVTTQVESDPGYSGGQSVKVLSTGAGSYVEFTLPAAAAGTYDLSVYYKAWTNRGIVQGSLNATAQGSPVDMYAANPTFQVAGALGTSTWAANEVKTLRLTVTGKNAASSGYYLHIDKFVLQPSGATNAVPTIASGPTASPATVTGTTTALSVVGADDGGEANLTYTWATTGTPPAAVSFSTNGTNAAKNTTATFTKAGSYAFQVTVRDAQGATATGTLSVPVNATLKSISVSPATAVVSVNATQQFAATALDQFAGALTAQPTIAWTVSGGGTIGTDGRFTAGGTAGGPYTVSASASGVTGTAAVTVSNAATTYAFEAETLVRSSNVSTVVESDPGYSAGQSVKVQGSAVNDYVQFTLPGVAAGTYGVAVYYKAWTNRPIVQGALDGAAQSSPIDMYASSPVFQVRGDMGTKTWTSSGDRVLRLTITGKNAGSSGYTMHIDKIVLSPPVAPKTYTTSFSLTENPISEGGLWLNGRTDGIDWFNVQATPGHAFGEPSPSNPRYADPTAVLKGTWGPDQTLTATVFCNKPTTSYYQEVELRLRHTVAPHSITGYEVAWRCLTDSNGYVGVARWNGGLGNFTSLAQSSGAGFGVATGDEVKATIVGNVITAYKNGVQQLTVTDGTFATGNPGIGFNYGVGPTNADFGFTTYTATSN